VREAAADQVAGVVALAYRVPAQAAAAGTLRLPASRADQRVSVTAGSGWQCRRLGARELGHVGLGQLGERLWIQQQALLGLVRRPQQSNRPTCAQRSASDLVVFMAVLRGRSR